MGHTVRMQILQVACLDVELMAPCQRESRSDRNGRSVESAAGTDLHLVPPVLTWAGARR